MPTRKDWDDAPIVVAPDDIPSLPERLAVREAIAICLLSAGAMTTLSLMSYWPQDVSLNAAAGVPGAPTHNWIGPVGALWADLCLQGLGLVAWVFAAILLVVGTRTLLRRSISPKPGHVLCFLLLTVTVGTLVELLLVGHHNPYPMGGLFGALCARGLRQQFNPVGAAVLAAAGALMSLTVCFGGVISGLAARVATQVTATAVRYGNWGRDGARLAAQMQQEERQVLTALDEAWSHNSAHPDAAVLHALDPIMVSCVQDPQAADAPAPSAEPQHHAAWVMQAEAAEAAPVQAHGTAPATAGEVAHSAPADVDDGPAIDHDEAAMAMAMACLSRDEAAGQGPAADLVDADADIYDATAMAAGTQAAVSADVADIPRDALGDEAQAWDAQNPIAAADTAAAPEPILAYVDDLQDPDADAQGQPLSLADDDDAEAEAQAEAAAMGYAAQAMEPAETAGFASAPAADVAAAAAAAAAESAETVAAIEADAAPIHASQEFETQSASASADEDGAARALSALLDVMQNAEPTPEPLAAADVASAATVTPDAGPALAPSPSPVGAVAAPQTWPTMAASNPAPYALPPADLLDFTPVVRSPVDTAVLQDNALKLTRTLKEYGIEGHVREIRPGPVVTMYEYVPGPGIKLSRIASLADDLAMSMEALRVRIVAPIPGKGAVGIEIPNEVREMVFFKEIISHAHFTDPASPLTMALGKDIEGCPAVADLARMPHLLVAGATGAGKSVSINAMIMSVLFKATPSQVRIIMVDPKMLELSVYEGIPHLLLPVVTDAKKAALALRWAVEEMERRYELLAEVGVRNIDGYNARVQAGVERGEPVTVAGADPDGLRRTCERLPYLLVIVDELADLMMVASRDVETSIMRLAQMARAAGIHLVLATQRPSVDVLTGVIKANFPTRIAFQVASRHDSRTIIDAQGAEHLLGRGDMLYMSSAAGGMARIHGAYVSEEDIERTVNFVKAQGQPEYDESILTQHADDGEMDAELEALHDEMYDQAVAVVAESQQASISMIQRRLRIGYNRAARMVERMEIEGIVGPADGAKPREVIVSNPS